MRNPQTELAKFKAWYLTTIGEEELPPSDEEFYMNRMGWMARAGWRFIPDEGWLRIEEGQ